MIFEFLFLFVFEYLECSIETDFEIIVIIHVSSNSYVCLVVHATSCMIQPHSIVIE